MFCPNCGEQITVDEAFCPNCGQKLTQNTAENSNFGVGGDNWNFDKGNSEASQSDSTKKITLEDVERFAPAASIAPLAMGLAVGILGALLVAILGEINVVGNVVKAIVIIFKIVFCLAALAATVGLVYVAVKKKRLSNFWTWVSPIVTFMAFLSCIFMAFSLSVPAWIFGTIAVILGFELFARITLAGNPMDTPMQPLAAFSTYSRYIKAYKQKYPSKNGDAKSRTANELRPTRIYDADSYFDGSGVELLGYYILGSIICGVTCGLAAPWIICKVYKWKSEHTYINGKKLYFNGSGFSLLGHWILWAILTVITCGIYGYFAYVALKKWELSHTFIADEPILPEAKTSYFDGNSFEYLGYGILSTLICCITCGIGTPWSMCIVENWQRKHMVVNSHRMQFSGSGLGFLGECIIIILLTVITCGIYTPWAYVRMTKYIIRNTDFID